MEYRNGLKIIGISIETTNENGKSMKDLGLLWDKFYRENISNKINWKVSNLIYSIYTDYESDYTGKYTTIIGMEVDSLDDLPEGMIGREFEGGKFVKFTTSGELPDAIGRTWQKIWANDQELNRRYTADYEIHDPSVLGGDEAKVDIYIAVR